MTLFVLNILGTSYKLRFLSFFKHFSHFLTHTKKREKKERICGHPSTNNVGHSGTGQETNFCKGGLVLPLSVHLEVGLGVGAIVKGSMEPLNHFCRVLFCSSQ